MTNLTITTPAPTASTRPAPRAITTARTLWVAVSGCSAVIAATSLVMLTAAAMTGASHTAAGIGLISTVITILLAAAISWFAFTGASGLRRGGSGARRPLTVLTAGLVIAMLIPGTSTVFGGVLTGLAVLAAGCNFLPSANRFVHPRRSNR